MCTFPSRTQDRTDHPPATRTEVGQSQLSLAGGGKGLEAAVVHCIFFFLSAQLFFRYRQSHLSHLFFLGTFNIVGLHTNTTQATAGNLELKKDATLIQISSGFLSTFQHNG